MKPPRKRYKSADDVRKAIDKAYETQANLKLRAAALQDDKVSHDALDYRDTKKWFQHNSSTSVPNMGYRNRVADKLWKRANGMEDGTFKKLGRKLAEIQTQLLIGTDESIPK